MMMKNDDDDVDRNVAFDDDGGGGGFCDGGDNNDNDGDNDDGGDDDGDGGILKSQYFICGWEVRYKRCMSKHLTVDLYCVYDPSHHLSDMQNKQYIIIILSCEIS
ncbi:MAG: hypothetical protein ABW185_12990 [Sedimenticola sp.]